ncbi:MAG: GGDEF domain-containing protein [Oscillospiraceae bacterium]
MIYVSRELRAFILNLINMLKISSATMEDRLDPIYREVECDRINMNYTRIIPSSLLLLVVEVCGIIYNVMMGSTVGYQIIYVVSFVLFSIISFGILAYMNYTLKGDAISDKAKEAVFIIYWIVYTLSAMAFGIFETLDTGTTNHFIVFIIAFTFWPMFTPILTIPYYLSAFFVEFSFLLYVKAPYITIILCLGLTIVGILTSYVKFSSYMSIQISQKKLEQLAEVDPLTGLSNRRGMRRSVDVIWNYCKGHKIPITLAILDIDFFKMYNDTYGHANGDECLKIIGGCIKESFSRRTDITARFGGEEFVVILSGETSKQAIMSLVNLQNKIEGMGIKSGNQEFNEYVTVSAGVYSAEITEQLTFNDVLTHADSELYNAKAKGRKCLSFNGEIYNKIIR